MDPQHRLLLIYVSHVPGSHEDGLESVDVLLLLLIHASYTVPGSHEDGLESVDVLLLLLIHASYTWLS